MPNRSHSSFMKAARQHYQMPGGRWIAAGIALLLAGLIALSFKLDTVLTGQVAPHRTLRLVLFDLGAMLVLMVIAVQHRTRLLWNRAQDGRLGTRLQTRIITMFCGIAILPTVMVATFSLLFFNVGMRSWFDTQVASALEDSITLATAYVEEHKEAMRSEAVDLSTVLHQQRMRLANNAEALTAALTAQAEARGLSEAIVFTREGVVARSALSFSLMFERLPEVVLARADGGQVAVFGDDQTKIQAVVALDRLGPYLLITRVVDPKVLEHMRAAKETVAEYHKLQVGLSTLQHQFFAVFVLVALIILMASLWAGILLAVRLIEPLRALMLATEQVRGGDYSIRVPEGRADDEIANLGRTFNRMTGELESSRQDLMEANRRSDERRRFTEAVLLGVSAGVIALGEDERVMLHNRSASELLGREADFIGTPIAELMPDVVPLIAQVQQTPSRMARGQMVIACKEKRLTLHVQVTAERSEQAIERFIVTFDDITALVSAQRAAAWADVARRIAHEIKNPLTPITLSAERLRKKFAPEEPGELRESFERYVETIARHTRDIGRMVEEFVAYARLPASVFHEEDLVALVRKTVFSSQTVNADVRYTLNLPDAPVPFTCDEGQLGRALLNLLKNAGEAMEGREVKEIHLTLVAEAAAITLTIEDNGPGFPEDKLATLTEPYVTTRTKGTGLGLAIVKRTIEEHKGTLTLSNRAEGGARVVLTLPR